MADITMCKNTDCNLYKTCWRFNAPKEGYIDSYGNFVDQQAYSDFQPDDDGNCKFYWPMDKTDNNANFTN